MENQGVERELEHALSLYRAIFRESKVGMSVYDGSGQCIEANEAIGLLIGAHREQALAQNYHQIESWKTSGLLASALLAVETHADTHHETTVTTTYGRRITIDFHFVPFRVSEQEYLLLLVSDVSERKEAEAAREHLVVELQEALSHVTMLKGIVPICASCKKIRDDEGFWKNVESYVSRLSGAAVSHGICPDCARKFYPDLVDGKTD